MAENHFMINGFIVLFQRVRAEVKMKFRLWDELTRQDIREGLQKGKEGPTLIDRKAIRPEEVPIRPTLQERATRFLKYFFRKVCWRKE